jgi:phospholipase C
MVSGRAICSPRIVKVDGSPGPNFARAHQFQITAPPNGPGNFFMSAGALSKTPYLFLPAPDVNGVQNPPDAGLLTLTPTDDPGLPASAEFLLGTGGTGLTSNEGPDLRITHDTSLPPGPFQMTGPTMPYDPYTRHHPSVFPDGAAGRPRDRYRARLEGQSNGLSARPAVGDRHNLRTSPLTTPPQVPHDTGQTMAFFNMQNGDVPLFKSLADQ